MGNDITGVVFAEPLRHGAIQVGYPVGRSLATGTGLVNYDRAINTPTLVSVQTKYADRFDDPTYY